MLPEIDEIAQSYNPLIKLLYNTKIIYKPNMLIDRETMEFDDIDCPIKVYGGTINSYTIIGGGTIAVLITPININNRCLDCRRDLTNIVKIGEFCCKCWTIDKHKIDAFKLKSSNQPKIRVNKSFITYIRSFTTSYQIVRCMYNCNNGCYDCENGFNRLIRKTYTETHQITYTLQI